MRVRATRLAVAAVLGTGVLGAVGLIGAGPAGATTDTSFTITVNSGSSASISESASATLAFSGLPGDATGTVEFDAGTTVLCTADVSTDTSCTTSGLAPGTYAGITATYSGDSAYTTSDATNTVALTVTADTAFTITVDGGSSASISESAHATLAFTGLPGGATGTVEFDAGTTVLCTADVSTDTSCATSGLTPGTYAGITATYSGDSSYTTSDATNTVDLTVTADTAFTITVDGGPSSTIPETEDATLAFSGLPRGATGTVEFDAGTTVLCTADPATDTSCTTSGLTPGTYAGITATYSGDTSYTSSVATNTVTLTVGAVHVTCTKIAGHTTTKLQITKCGFTGKGVWMDGALAFGGTTAKWADSQQPFTYTATDTSPGQGACGAGRVEHDVRGVVTSSSSTRVPAGDFVGFQVCVNSTTHVVKLLGGTTASL
jgi:hypothetical protein